MRLKLLFFPLALIGAVIIGIWFLYPEYTNMKKLRQEVAQKEEELNGLSQKESNFQSLSRKLEESSAETKQIDNFLPYFYQALNESNKDKEEEELINYLNFLAVDSGVIVNELSIKEDKNTATAVLPSVEEEDKNKNTNPSNEEKKSLANPLVFVSADVKIIGDYQAIKKYVNEINIINKFNQIKYIRLGKYNEDPTMISGEIGVSFGYLSPVGLSDYVVGLKHPVFASGDLNFSALEKIQSCLITEKVPPIEIGTQGSVNPFANL